MNPEEVAVLIERELEPLKRRLRDLETRLDRADQNGLSVLRTGNLFAGIDGDYGTDPRAARADHTH